jgi:hypothetical protein
MLLHHCREFDQVAGVPQRQPDLLPLAEQLDLAVATGLLRGWLPARGSQRVGIAKEEVLGEEVCPSTAFRVGSVLSLRPEQRSVRWALSSQYPG